MKVLIIDDEESLLKLLQLSLKDRGVIVETASTAKEGLEKFEKDLFDAVLCDIGLPDADGLEVLDNLKARQSQTPVIMITAHGSVDNAIRSIKKGAYDYIQKPFEPEEIYLIIERAIHELELKQDYARLREKISDEYDFSNIIGKSKAMKKLFDSLKKAANSRSTVLVSGESGTGKELIARAIHFNSPRSKKPFVVVDCGSIPANLLEAELFGYVQGAFTGAQTSKKGLSEQAHGGSLFLDEIGELPLELQSKLLRLLQEGTIRRVGDTKEIDLDLRVITATNKNLAKEVKEKRFREDLFYRLNVIQLEAPPLRERQEDIPYLTYHFLKKFSKESGKTVEKVDAALMNRFLTYSWPGNIRQLENIIEQMVVMTDDKTLKIEQLPAPLKEDSEAVDSSPLHEDEWNLKEALAKVQSYTEESMIRRALKYTDYNKTKAAELLGVSRRFLIYKAQEYRIEDSE